MKEAIGYVTDDGTFFESSEEAEEWESWEDLRRGIIEVGSIDSEVFIKVVAAIPNEIRRYINANEAATRYREIQASLSAKDHSRRETNTQAVLEQPSRIGEPLPNVGSGIEQEEVRQQCKVDGIGSGRTDASNVRSSEDLAIRTYTKPTKARLNSSTSNIR